MASKLGTLTLDLVCRVGNFTQAMRQASNSASREMGRIESSTNGATNAIKGMAAMAVSAFSVSQISNYADSYTEIINKLKLVTVNQGQLNQAVGDTHRIAQITASEWSAVNDVYSKYMSNAKALNLTQQEVARLTEITSKAVSISGSNSQAAAGALFQYGQALDGNILRAEEYNSLVDGAGGLLNAMAKGLNTTRGGLRQMMLDGKLTGEVIADALMKAGSNVDELYSKTATTVAASFNLVKNESIRLIGEFDSATGASATFVKGMGVLAQNIDFVTKGMMVGAAYMAGSYIPAIYQSVAAKKAKILSTFEEIQAENAAIIQAQRKAQAEHTAAQAEMTRARDAVISAEMQVNADRAVIASEIQRMQSTIAATNVEKAQEAQRLRSQINDVGKAQSISRMAQLQQVQAIQVAELTALEAKLGATTLATSRVYEAARNTQTAATTRLTTATAGLNAANAMSARSSFSLLGALGGPVGLGLTVAAVAASYLLLKDSTDESTKSLRENNESVDEAIAKYRDLEEAKQKSQLVTEKEQLNELKEARDNATDSLITNAYALTRHNDVTAIQSKELNALIAEFKKNGDINQFSKSINALTFINQKSKDQFNKLAGTVSDTNRKYKAQKSLIDEINKLTPNAVKATDDRAAAAERERKAIEAANKAYADYSKSAFADIKEIAARKFFQEKGLSKNQTDERMAVLKAFDYNNQALKTDIGKEAIKLADINAKMKDAEEVRAEALKKQTEELKEQGKALKVNSLVAANALKANATALETADRLPKGLLSAVNMVESPNSNTATSPAGAGGPMQFMPATADRFKVNIKSVESSYRGASEYLSRLLDMFDGNLENALRAYNWGEGNMQNFLKYGSGMKKVEGKWQKGYFADRPMPQETRQYSGKVMSYMAGASGQTFGTDYTVENYLSGLEKANEAFQKFKNDQAQFSQQFSSEDVIRNQERIDTIAKANELGLQHLTPKIEEHYANKSRLAELQFDQELNSWNWTEDEKLKKEAEINKAHIALSSELNDIQKQLAKESVDEQLAYDLQQFRKAQKWKEFEAINDFKAIQDQIRGLSSNTDDIFAKATMTPIEYESWSLKNNRDSAKLDLRNNLTSVEQNIVQSDAFDSEDDRYQALIDAHKEYRDALAAIDVQYDQQVKDLAQSQYDSQMGIWQDLLSRTGTIFNDMAAMVKETSGESSAAYKSMFLINQGISMAQAVINTEVAATKAMAEGGYIAGIPMSTAIRALGYASVGLIAGQTIAGMAHDGIDNIPREGTWLLDRGERVVDRRTNSDLKDYLADRNNGRGQPVVNVHTLPGTTAVASTNDDGSLDIRIQKLAEQTVANQLKNPNSRISQTMSQNYNSQRRR